ncbi:Fur family transcriptional regulator [Larsenimonas rhizosphaerae]|uniref:Ferric uptake regulation protein n=1 Tax=Larsenimonas rhizosphaerae TaxID=2944682 RepID=A0AA42CTM7_9GAMM|nr:transcriptional repressor [Larsenimonas rhizosphaerae]MCM2130695.1 transcriptional repressor [Larsenimonas rhizosphaerae]MCX2523399.1 transcriptional repressor [Larsenimonas rhizosphaerae]
MAHTHSLKNMLAAAEHRCADRGVRFTAIRQRVFELIAGSDSGLKAYDVLDRLTSEHASARPPTVYRALDFLLELGLIHRIESLNAYVACPCPDHHRGFQLMICKQCGFVQELHDTAIAADLDAAGKREGFHIERQTIELLGICETCRSE